MRNGWLKGVLLSCLLTIGFSGCPEVHLGKSPAVGLDSIPITFEVKLGWDTNCFHNRTKEDGAWLTYRVAHHDGAPVSDRLVADIVKPGSLEVKDTISLPGVVLHDTGKLELKFHFEVCFGPDSDHCVPNPFVPPPESLTVPLRLLRRWTAFLPPIVCILAAVALRQVIPALFVGVWVASLLANGNFFMSLLNVVGKYVPEAIADMDHAQIITFTLLLGGMVGVLAQSGSAMGFAELLGKFATTSTRGQLAVYGLAVLVFFDDYTNVLIVGSSMRPVTDRLHISREKFAFVADCVAAPMVSIAPISSWVAYELGLIASGFDAIGTPGQDPYLLFLESVPYSFYPIVMLIFGLILIALRRDFPILRRYELNARRKTWIPSSPASLPSNSNSMYRKPPIPLTSWYHYLMVWRSSPYPPEEVEFSPISMKPGIPRRWANALAPIIITLFTILGGLALDGRNTLVEARDAAERVGLPPPPNTELTLQNLLNAGDAFSALTWGALAGSLSALFLVTFQRLLSFGESIEAWLTGAQQLLPPLLILIFAWALGEGMGDVGTAPALIDAMSDALDPGLLPVVVFFFGALISFATGSSWGTMAILFPLAMPLANALKPGDSAVMRRAIASILSGAVFGDHCSPISDTNIMTALATQCNLLNHVKTQLPYAVVAAVVSMVFGYIPVGLMWYPAPVGYLLATIALIIITLMFGVQTAVYPPPGIDLDDDDQNDPNVAGWEYMWMHMSSRFPVDGRKSKRGAYSTFDDD